jgi:hypothetical protein
MKTYIAVFLVCLTAALINHEQCEVKMFELQMQMELAKAIGRVTRPSLELSPSESGKDRL